MANSHWNYNDIDLKDNWAYYTDHKNNAPDYEKKKNELIQQIVNIVINKSQEIDIDKVVKAVIKRTLPHEKRQTSHIKKNSNNINDISNINVWDYR